MEPHAVVKHVSEEALLRSLRRITRTADAATMFAAHITGQRKRSHIHQARRILVVLHLNAVVGVIADASGNTESVFAQGVLITDKREPAIRTPQNLAADAGTIVETSVGLPAID